MPVKRRLSKGRPYKITPELIELWARLLDIRATDDDEEWEPVGRRREYLDGTVELNRALGVRPWEESPVTAEDPEPPDWMESNPMRCDGWRKAWDLRCALEAERVRTSKGRVKP